MLDEPGDRRKSTISALAVPRGNVRQRKQRILAHAEDLAPHVLRWLQHNRYYHDGNIEYLKFLIPEGKRVLDAGCGVGEILAALKPGRGVGVDFSKGMIECAKETHPDLEFIECDIEDERFAEELAGEPFDFIVLSDTIGSLEDCQSTLENLHSLCVGDTRVVIGYYSHLWEPIIQLGAFLRMKMPHPAQNYLRKSDIENILELAGFDVVKQEFRILCPKKMLGLGILINRYLAPLPGIRALCLRHYTVARSQRCRADKPASVSIIIPCRNERGNIADAIARIPHFCDEIEVIFVEGHSSDGTFDEIQRVMKEYEGPFKISAAVQDGKGKGDAVRKGFDMARGDLLMILDADLTVAPEDLPKFYNAMESGAGEFINGSRLVYPMENEAMRFLNLVGNAVFARLFSWLLNQRITDTLCGTKVLSRSHYQQLKEGRAYFGEFDPFGDFDLIFGASKLNLKFKEIPIRYASRAYGETQIDRFSHGFLLLRMVVFAFRKLKAF